MPRSVIVGLTVLLSAAGPAAAEDVTDPNYTTQNLMVFNGRCQVLLQRNFMGWSVPGLRYDRRETIRVSLEQLAQRYGLMIQPPRLSGIFSYQYGYTPAISTRSHYSATLSGGTAIAPKGVDEVRWFEPAAAVAAIASDTQKSPPALIEISRQLLTKPKAIWGGSFYIWRDGETYKSRVVEPFTRLGMTVPSGKC